MTSVHTPSPRSSVDEVDFSAAVKAKRDSLLSIRSQSANKDEAAQVTTDEVASETEVEESDKDDATDDDFSFADAPETSSTPDPPAPTTQAAAAAAPSSSSPPPAARSLTRMSLSTVSSAQDAPASEHSESSPVETTNRNSQVSITPATTANGSVHQEQDSSSGTAKSPLSTRRISTGSLDEVSLMDDLPPQKETPAEEAPASSPPPPPPTPPQPSTSFVESIANRFSKASAKDKELPATPSETPKPPGRKLSSPFIPKSFQSSTTAPAQTPPEKAPVRRSPFSWLRSSTSSNNTFTPPAPRARGETNASVLSTSTLPGDNELLMHQMGANRGIGDDKEEMQRGIENLRENFKKLREEAHTTPADGTVEAPATQGTEEPIVEETEPEPRHEDQIDWDLWQSVVDDALKVANERPTELNSAIQAGIPPTLRGTVWQSMAASKSLELEEMYREVIALGPDTTAEDARTIFGGHWLWDPQPTPSGASSPKAGATSPPLDPKVNGIDRDGKWGKTVSQLEKIIKRDLGDRTSFGRYKVDQKALLNVCKAYALFDPAVGYTQGMTFIVTVLLLNMSEEEAFCLFVKLMNKYKLRSMFKEQMKGLELRLYQYDRILEDHDPRLAIHLKRQTIDASLYAAQWFLTLFTYKFPLQLVLRVFDLLFSEGLEGPILKFGIILMKKNSEKLLTLEFDTLGPFLKERLFDVYIDSAPSSYSVMEAGFFGNGGEKEVYRANDLITDALSIEITQSLLDRHARDWEDAESIKRATDIELTTLRRSNTRLTSRVKKLEEQNEDLNREYVRIASSEVALKVENDSLADENEVLRGTVDGLRDMCDKQPEEVEGRLRGDMDKLMQKNLDVHRENQRLEESLAEMEKQLVDTKMHLATVNEEYDVLKNRWQDLKKALDN